MKPSSTSPFKGKRGFKRIVNATHYSMSGLQMAWQSESAFRQICVLGLLGGIMLVVLHIEKSAWPIIAASHFFCIAVELLNSGIEAAVDHTSLEEHPLAKRAKDLGSAAQSVCLLNLAVVWALSIFNGLF